MFFDLKKMSELLIAVPLFGWFDLYDDYLDQVFKEHYQDFLCYLIVKRNLQMNLSFVGDLSKKVYLIEKVNEEQWIAQNRANRKVLQE